MLQMGKGRQILRFVCIILIFSSGFSFLFRCSARPKPGSKHFSRVSAGAFVIYPSFILLADIFFFERVADSIIFYI